MRSLNIFGASLLVLLTVQCKENKKTGEKSDPQKSTLNESISAEVLSTLIYEKPSNIETPKGMVWIPGGEFIQGAVPQDKMAMSHEKPAHRVAVDGFFMDVTEVTNAQFSKFVNETGYITVAERAIDWEEMKSQVPEGTPKPHDSILQPGSLTFKKTKNSVPNLFDFSQWWNWTVGANWKQPNGPGSSIQGKDNEPVVQVAYEDALAYCKWANRRLPTEAEWERAARGKKESSIYFWGDEEKVLSQMANTWEGEFPVNNIKSDGFEARAKVGSYPPNEFGLYDMAGNVWEWTSDWYNVNYYKELQTSQQPIVNPKGATTAYNPNSPYAKEKVMKGGSFLCNASYCASYRISARMASSLDSSLEHLGFRTVATVEMLSAN
ncbi:Formylglycine-generating enzyme, required for sulfatase activity, contains SUMF1/FGE domain [Arenibacter nanhaiticus]|uniref:Formylglycine-generating enzyme, required for sulfatase activity, contains SUMF1/FGE domain n=1 Tax=Arenibacter nanhaiticus TaxID=558155 RepID=A0A1M6E3B1_9FLAO|nr:formylglycine-generating enzyme family protein [Arenibacter nanhaiticus]SHI79982.1 Formylglycine-generating enzyme, required for sulfatase activity, contains SUMF1/FGE domain [Arenibacter nanhaiticus]